MTELPKQKDLYYILHITCYGYLDVQECNFISCCA